MGETTNQIVKLFHLHSLDISQKSSQSQARCLGHNRHIPKIISIPGLAWATIVFGDVYLRGETCGTGILPVTGSEPVPHLHLIEKCYIPKFSWISFVPFQ